jgi:hypothetical protein
VKGGAQGHGRTMERQSRGQEQVGSAVDRLPPPSPGVVMTRLRTRKMGPFLLVDVEIEVPPKMSASAAHQVEGGGQNKDRAAFLPQGGFLCCFLFLSLSVQARNRFESMLIPVSVCFVRLTSLSSLI